MYGSDFVRTYLNVIPDALCDALIEQHTRLRQQGYAFPAEVMGGYTPRFKISELSHVKDGDEDIFQQVQTLLADLRERYYADLGIKISNQLRHVDVPPQIQRYPCDRGFYKEHIDVSSTKPKRVVSFVGYLNTVEEGGETHFPNQDLMVKPIKGKVTVFPPFWMYPHKALRPISEDKHSLITIHEVEANVC